MWYSLLHFECMCVCTHFFFLTIIKMGGGVCVYTYLIFLVNWGVHNQSDFRGKSLKQLRTFYSNWFFCIIIFYFLSSYLVFPTWTHGHIANPSLNSCKTFPQTLQFSDFLLFAVVLHRQYTATFILHLFTHLKVFENRLGMHSIYINWGSFLN